MEALISALFGFPALLAAIALALIGLWKKDWRWSRPSVLLILPFTFYLAGAPLFRWLALLLPLLQGLVVWFTYRQKRRAALLTQLPLLMLTVWLAYTMFLER
jgi:hypothetical protein